MIHSFGNTANLSGGFGNATNMTFNGGPPAAPGAPTLMRENTAELRHNTAAMRDLSASLGDITSGADTNDDGADPAPPDQEDDTRDTTSPSAEGEGPSADHRKITAAVHRKDVQGRQKEDGSSSLDGMPNTVIRFGNRGFSARLVHSAATIGVG